MHYLFGYLPRDFRALNDLIGYVLLCHSKIILTVVHAVYTSSVWLLSTFVENKAFITCQFSMQLQYFCIQSNLLCFMPFIMPFINVTLLNHSAAESLNDVTADIRTASDFTRVSFNSLESIPVTITVCRPCALASIEWCRAFAKLIRIRRHSFGLSDHRRHLRCGGAL